jgi:hypothetical protein
MKNTAIVITLLITGISISSSAHAYLDPGTGSLLLQGLIAGIALAVSTAKLWWIRFVAFFKNNTAHIEDSQQEEQTKEQD